MRKRDLTLLTNGLPKTSDSGAVNLLYERFRDLIVETKAAQNDVARITKQGFLGRFVSNVSGETGRAFAHAQGLQGKLQQAQVALAFVNLQLIGQLKAQQDTIDQQQHELAEANDRLERQQTEVAKTTANVEKQQETIFQLLNLSAEQETKIRDIVQTANDIKKLEKTLTQAIDAAATSEAKARTEVEQRLAARLNIEVVERENAVQNVRKQIEEKVAAFHTDLADAKVALQRGLLAVESQHSEFYRAHLELPHARLVEKHNSTTRFARRIGYIAALALLLAVVSLVLSFI